MQDCIIRWLTWFAFSGVAATDVRVDAVAIFWEVFSRSAWAVLVACDEVCQRGSVSAAGEKLRWHFTFADALALLRPGFVRVLV